MHVRDGLHLPTCGRTLLQLWFLAPQSHRPRHPHHHHSSFSSSHKFLHSQFHSPRHSSTLHFIFIPKNAFPRSILYSLIIPIHSYCTPIFQPIHTNVPPLVKVRLRFWMHLHPALLLNFPVSLDYT